MLKRSFCMKLMLASSMLFAIVLLFMSLRSYADEIDVPADEPVEEEYVVVDDYYSNTNTYYINSNSYSQNHYDEMYLLYVDYDDFISDLSNINKLEVNIRLGITRNASNNSSRGYICVKNWHTNDDPLCDDAETYFDIDEGTYYYYFTFECRISDIGNSLCFCYRATDNWWWTDDTWVLNRVEISFYYYVNPCYHDPEIVFGRKAEQ